MERRLRTASVMDENLQRIRLVAISAWRMPMARPAWPACAPPDARALQPKAQR